MLMSTKLNKYSNKIFYTRMSLRNTQRDGWW